MTLMPCPGQTCPCCKNRPGVNATRGRHDDDEIEVDIETLDNDTLRHLQKYVKASLSKKRTSIKKSSAAASAIDSARHIAHNR